MSSTPSTILARLVRRFGLLVVVTALGAGTGGIYGQVKTPTYRAQAYVVLTAEPGESFAAVNFAQAYGRIVTNGPVTDAAATALGSRDGLSTVTATTSPDAPVIEITATGADAKRTADVANAVAKALAEYATARKAETRVTASVLAPASTPTAPSSPKPPLELVVGAAAGLLVGGLAALAGAGRTRRGTTAAVAAAGQDVVRTPVQPVWASGTVATALVPVPPDAAADPPPPLPPGMSWPPMAIAWNAAPPETSAWKAAPPQTPAWNAAPPQTPAAPPDAPDVVAAPQQPAEPPKVIGRAVVIRRESL
ncbi:YveK family protein [Dactylosporangium cerinum]|uniref:YveK family protein n=1 Tax=Dactylosporangium cerinum TaxID=1434730 RepID=A0ABV9W5P1_9ACTN